MGKFATLGPRVPVTNLRVAPVADKETGAHYGTAAHKDWRLEVKHRAGFRCEAVEDGRRCERSTANGDTLYADHIQEIKDGGAALDLANGKCLCARHHTLKTHVERERRFYESPAASAPQ